MHVTAIRVYPVQEVSFPKDTVLILESADLLVSDEYK
jgi:hypothetical protein